jgi:hypothetical protein
MTTSEFHEERFTSTPIRELGLVIAGTPLERALTQFRHELARAGIRLLQPDFHLSTEWGVPFGTISIGIPFYLSRPELIAIHAQRVGHLEGASPPDVLRYLRHEMGHVVNYAYKLYEQEDWIKLFGSITQPYLEDYRPEPFSRRFVCHLPGWYAQKHPDEDWSETFAVWMTPDFDWRAAYADSPTALEKLTYCDAAMALLNQRAPEVAVIERDEDVGDLSESVNEFYHVPPDQTDDAWPRGLDGAIRSIFEDFDKPDNLFLHGERLPSAALIRRIEPDVVANVYRWTGHFPEHTRRLIRHLEKRSEELQQVYPANGEAAVTVAFTTLVTSLAMNHVLRGSYVT